MSRFTVCGAQPRLQLEVALWRYGWIWLLVGVMMMTAAMGSAWWWPQQQRELADMKIAVIQAQSEQERRRIALASLPTMSGDDAVLAELRQRFYAQAQISRVLLTISAMAKAEGIVLVQSTFQTSTESHGGLHQVQVTLPMMATYPQVRHFVESILGRLPGVSVDQLGLRREGVSQGQADVRLKLSLWIDPNKVVGTPNSGEFLKGAVLVPASETVGATNIKRKVSL